MPRMSYFPAPVPYAPPPKRNNTVLIVLLAVGIPLALILCCVGTVVVGPALGIGFLESSKAKTEAAVKPVAGDWANADGSVDLSVSRYAGDLSISFSDPLKTGYCEGGIKNPADPEFPVTFWAPPCGPVTGTTGLLKLDGSQLTLTIPGIPDIVLHKSP
jgi:hypothetical protein